MPRLDTTLQDAGHPLPLGDGAPLGGFHHDAGKVLA